MINKLDTNAQRLRCHKRVCGKIFGTPERPRPSAPRSNTNIYTQVVDDVIDKTLVSVSPLERGFEDKGSDCKAARRVSLVVAECAKITDIGAVMSDRDGYAYHSRVQALAEDACKGGLQS